MSGRGGGVNGYLRLFEEPWGTRTKTKEPYKTLKSPSTYPLGIPKSGGGDVWRTDDKIGEPRKEVFRLASPDASLQKVCAALMIASGRMAVVGRFKWGDVSKKYISNRYHIYIYIWSRVPCCYPPPPPPPIWYGSPRTPPPPPGPRPRAPGSCHLRSPPTPTP